MQAEMDKVLLKLMDKKGKLALLRLQLAQNPPKTKFLAETIKAPLRKTQLGASREGSRDRVVLPLSARHAT